MSPFSFYTLHKGIKKRLWVIIFKDVLGKRAVRETTDETMHKNVLLRGSHGNHYRVFREKLLDASQNRRKMEKETTPERRGGEIKYFILSGKDEQGNYVFVGPNKEIKKLKSLELFKARKTITVPVFIQ